MADAEFPGEKNGLFSLCFGICFRKLLLKKGRKKRKTSRLSRLRKCVRCLFKEKCRQKESEESENGVESPSIEDRESRVEYPSIEDSENGVKSSSIEDSESCVESPSIEDSESCVESSSIEDSESCVESPSIEDRESRVEYPSIEDSENGVESSSIEDIESCVESPSIEDSESCVESSSIEDSDLYVTATEGSDAESCELDTSQMDIPLTLAKKVPKGKPFEEEPQTQIRRNGAEKPVQDPERINQALVLVTTFLEPVIVNVYHLAFFHKINNRFLGKIGYGVFHSGVVVYGSEYTIFGRRVRKFSPRKQEGFFFTFKKSIHIGYTTISQEDVRRKVYQLSKEDFKLSELDRFRKNCNHFSAALVQVLCGKQIPKWINRFSTTIVCCGPCF